MRTWMRVVAVVCALVGARVWAQSPLEVTALRPPSGSGNASAFGVTVSDGNGGRDVASVGLYVTARFDAVRPGSACLVYWDRSSGEFRLARDGGDAWDAAAMASRRTLGNSQCSVDGGVSRVSVGADGRMTVEFAVRFATEWTGSRRVYVYANSFGDTRNTGWKEAGSWLVTREAAASAATAGNADPDSPTKELDRTDTDYAKFLRANPTATELTHAKGVLRLAGANGRRAAIAGAVTHQDATSKWVANAPVLSETNQGWRLDGTSNGLVIRKKGLDKHEITQTFTDGTSKHASTLVLTVPSLIYDKKQIFHFAQDGLTWNLTTDLSGAFNLAASVAAKRGKATYTFDVASSESLTVNAKGDLVGDANVRMSRAMMFPKYGKPVACSAWTYSVKGGASFVCDDSGFTAKQLPYRIDPSSHTYTDTGTYVMTHDRSYDPDSQSWNVNYGTPTVSFNTSGLIPGGGSLLGTSCGFDWGDNNFPTQADLTCAVGTYNNSGNTNVTFNIRPYWESNSCGEPCEFSEYANISNISLTVNYINGVSVSVTAPWTMNANTNGNYVYAFLANAAVDSPGTTAVTWSTTPSGVITVQPDNSAPGPNGAWLSTMAVDAATAVTVRATSVYDSSKSGTATVTVQPLTPSVVVSPGVSAILSGQTQQFSATVVNRVTQTVTWSISPSVGTISSSGLYTAPTGMNDRTVITVTATSTVSGVSGSTKLLVDRPYPSGLVAWWAAEGSMADVVSGAVGTAGTCSLSYAAGKYGQGFSLRCGSYTTPVRSTTSGSIGGARTLMAWVNPLSTAGMSVLTGGSGGDDDFGISGSGLGTTNGGSVSVTIPTNAWTHVAAVYNGSSVTYYVNGSAVGTNTGSMGSYNLNTYQIGQSFGGVLDEVQIYNRALSAAEVVQAMTPISVSLSPATKRVYGGGTQQFTASVANNAGLSGSVTWSISPASGSGTMSSSGLYTAPTTVSTTSTVTVIAMSVADPGRTGTAAITLSAPVSVSVAAGSSMTPSQMQRFNATVNNSDDPSVTWAVTSGPGAINSAGWYTSPAYVASATSVTLTATSVFDGSKSGATIVTVNPLSSGAAYRYYESDNFTSSIDPTRWATAGTVNPGATGLSGWPGIPLGMGGYPGGIVARSVSGDGSNDYEAVVTLNLGTSINPLFYESSYTAVARATEDLSSYYGLKMINPWPYPSIGCGATYSVIKVVSGSVTEIARFDAACRNGMTLAVRVRGSSITAVVDGLLTYTFTDTALTTGKGGMAFVPLSGTSVSNIKIGSVDKTAPPAVSSVVSSPFPTRVDLQWPAVADEDGGSGLFGYQVSRGGTLLGTAAGAQFEDVGVTAGSSYTYSIAPVDRHGNVGTAVTTPVAVPTSGTDQRRIGVRGTGSYWGAAGEQIDLLSGNLNFALPLLSAKSRGGWGMGLMLSYNSQMWRQESGVSWKLGKDVGYGLGWRLQAGSVFPVWVSGSLKYCIFTDATGSEYRLEQAGTSALYRSKEGIYVTYDSSSQRLYFPDGSWWGMFAQSSSLEDDGGTLYPTSMNDTNGNSILIHYLAGAGSAFADTSARISTIEDARATRPGGVGPYLTYTFTYSGGRLASITNQACPN